VFAAGTSRYFDELPDLSELTPNAARRLMSAAYADVLGARDELERSEGPPPEEVVSFLRRVSSALEAHAVFADDVSGESTQAAAFVAAEAISLLGALLPSDDAEEIYRLASRPGFEAAEAGLLYMVAGFDSNAELLAERLSSMPRHIESVEARAAETAADALVRLMRRRSLETPAPGDAQPLAIDEPLRAVSRARAAVFQRLAHCVDGYFRWLTLTEESLDTVMSALAEASAALETDATARYADLHHILRLLEVAVSTTSRRALRAIPGPPDSRYTVYVAGRSTERPLVFPSALSYAEECLPGPQRHAAVALPTGSGKSFIAEVAAAQAVLRGWVLYLVPTNALAGQVRRDLSRGLRHIEGVEVRAFIGDGQYTELEGETVGDLSAGDVLVMTPEKCALALRRSPEAFESLALCVFDECHLISDLGGRGVTAELVAAHVLALAPSATFLLLSAMVENPDAAARWLGSATGADAVSIQIPWRPTRTLRGVLGFSLEPLVVAAESAEADLSQKQERQKNLTFTAPYSALVNLQGAWENVVSAEYALLSFDLGGSLTLHRERRNGEWAYEVMDDGYLNPSIGTITSFLASRGERVLSFVPRTRHDPFLVATLTDFGERIELEATTNGRILEAYLAVADADLGVASPLRELFRRRVAVHSSTLTDAERAASETAYQRDVARVMIATGTLAQGLNLPATAVVIGGTSIGYTQGEDQEAAASRTRTQLLNAIGRSGRAGVANHALALVVPNRAVVFEDRDADPQTALARADLLRYEDASTPLQSRLVSLVRGAIDGTLVGGALTLDEMVAYTYLPTGDDAARSLSQRILARTFVMADETAAQAESTALLVTTALEEVGEQFVAQAQAPAWTTEVAYRSGLPLPDVFALYSAVTVRDDPPPTDIDGWLEFLVACFTTMPRQNVLRILDASRPKRGFLFSAIWEEAPPSPESWAALEHFWQMFLHGATIADLAAFGLGIETEIDGKRSSGAYPIPKTLVCIQDVSYRMAIVAGALAAMWAVGVERSASSGWVLEPRQKEALEMLPLAVRCGCGTRSSLGWYRFGVRYRAAAHVMAESFAVPDDLPDDAAVRDWVRRTKRDWLADLIAPDHETEETSRLENIRTVMRLEA
jgi:hypothetical protein